MAVPCALRVAGLLWCGWWLISCFYPELHHRNHALFTATPAPPPLSRAPKGASHFTCQQKCRSTPALDRKHTTVYQTEEMYMIRIHHTDQNDLSQINSQQPKVIMGISTSDTEKLIFGKFKAIFKGGFVSWNLFPVDITYKYIVITVSD